MQAPAPGPHPGGRFAPGARSKRDRRRLCGRKIPFGTALSAMPDPAGPDGPAAFRPTYVKARLAPLPLESQRLGERRASGPPSAGTYGPAPARKAQAMFELRWFFLSGLGVVVAIVFVALM